MLTETYIALRGGGKLAQHMVRKSSRKRWSLRRHGQGTEDDIKTDVGEIMCACMQGMPPAQNKLLCGD